MGSGSGTSRGKGRGRAVLLGGGGGGTGFVQPTETNVHGDALCFMVMGPSRWRVAVGDGWQWAAVAG